MVTGRRLRWAAAVLVAGAGAAALGWGAWMRQPEIGLLGLAAWLALAIVLVVAVRQRADVAMQLGSASRYEVGRILEHVGRLEQQLEQRFAQAAELQSGIDARLSSHAAAVADVAGETAQAQETLRRFVVEGNELALNGYRELSLALDAQRVERAAATRRLLEALAEARAFSEQLDGVRRGESEAMLAAVERQDEIRRGESEAMLAAVARTAGDLVAALADVRTGLDAELHGLADSVASRLDDSRERIAELRDALAALADAHAGAAAALRGDFDAAMAVSAAAADDRLAKRLRGVQRALDEPLQQVLARIGSEEIGTQLRAVSNEAGDRLAAEIVRNRKETRARLDVLGTAVNEGVVGAIERIVAGQQRLAAPLDTLTNERRMRRFSQATMDWLKTDTVVEIAALLELPRRLPTRLAMPPQTSYAMQPSALLAIVEQIEKRSPQRVVECGSGMSTLWIGYALEQAGRGRLYSLEHLPRYADEGRDRVVRHGLQDVVDVLDAPLAPWDVDGQEQSWYGPDAVAALPDGIDLLLVDGPPESTGPMARYPALPLLGGKLADGALVILDDADRVDEKEIIDRWRERFAGLGEPFKLGPRTVAMEFRA